MLCLISAWTSWKLFSMALESFLSFLMGLHEYASIRVWTLHYVRGGSCEGQCRDDVVFGRVGPYFLR